MHVSVEPFGARRMAYLAYTVPSENFPTFVFRGRRVHIIKPLWWIDDDLCPANATPF